LGKLDVLLLFVFYCANTFAVNCLWQKLNVWRIILSL
jgi:hypothetical protein